MLKTKKSTTSSNAQDRRWVEYVVLLIITALAASLRLYKLGEWSFWVDELYTLRAASRPYIETLENPFFFLIRLTIDFLGVDAVSLRLLPVLFGTITIPVLYFPFRVICNKVVALLAVFLLAISPWHIYLSQLSRWYSLLLLVSTLSLTSFYFYIERHSLIYLGGSILLFIFAFLLHLTAGFVLMIGIIYLAVLSRLKKVQPPNFSSRKVNFFLVGLSLVALLFIPKLLDFVRHWQTIRETMGYWGTTPIVFSLKALYHLTPSIGIVSLAGLLLLLKEKERKGLFFAIYCLLPPIILNFAALFKTNVSVKYIFFILPGLCLAASYFWQSLFEQLRSSNKLIGLTVVGAMILPALQADYHYFTSGHGNRDRLNEAIQLVKQRSFDDDQIFLLYFFETLEESKFYFNGMAALNDFSIRDNQFIVPNDPEDIDLNKRIWVLTIGQTIPPYATGFYKWIADHTNLIAEFQASRGPEDNSVKVYLHRPVQ